MGAQERSQRADSDGAEVNDLFVQYLRTRDLDLRNELVVRHIELASAMARRFLGRGEPLDDLEQVARFGLLKAVERFDIDRGVPFAGFAVPTILGELKRHFRDRTWSGSIRRSVKDLLPRVRRADEELCGRLGRAVTPAEVAEHLGVSVEEVIEALEAGMWYRASSLSTPPSGARVEGQGLGATLASDFDGIGVATDRILLGSLVGRLEEREQRIIVARFAEDLSQDEIAERLGISQMHVSRLLRKALAKLAEMGQEQGGRDDVT